VFKHKTKIWEELGKREREEKEEEETQVEK